jgi:preprotein translocase subunit SecA
VNSHLIETNKLSDEDYSEILEATNENLLKSFRLNLSEIKGRTPNEVIEIIYQSVLKDYNQKLEEIPQEVINEFEKAISLRVIDSNWMEHISSMSHLREGIGLRGYANENPLQAYTIEGFDMFDAMLNKINQEISIYLLKSEIRQNTERQEVVKKVIANDGKETIKSQKKSDKIGRNDQCPCGSGKKYKQCCGK